MKTTTRYRGISGLFYDLHCITSPMFLLVTWWWPKTGTKTCCRLKI